jgi:hypothetical protein
VFYLLGLNLREYIAVKTLRDQEERDQEEFKAKIAKKREELHREQQLQALKYNTYNPGGDPLNGAQD